MDLKTFNELDKTAAKDLLATTCGSTKWQNLMMDQFPFSSEKHMVQAAVAYWYNYCDRGDWLEAFSHHPKIGDTKDLAARFPDTKHLAGNEQAGVQIASSDTMELLAKANELYEAKFGYIFIVFATGRSASEMLRILQDRSSNAHEEEIIVAIGEQLKITIQRFKKILPDADWTAINASQLTTHVLDTTLGRPAKEMTIRLKHFVNNGWFTLAQGVTNKDGRVGDLLPSEKNVLPGDYKMVFETARYFKANDTSGLYPAVEICFTVSDESHYHIPLLLNPFGYSTYRGS